MRRLLVAETSRWLARRGLWITLACGIAVACLAAVSMVSAARPPSGASVEEGRRYYAEAHAQWAEYAQVNYQSCIEGLPEDQRKDCAGLLEEPKEADFIPQPLGWTDAVSGAANAGAGLGGILAMILAASFWGAEYRHGTVSTWLTFVPNRTRVWASRFAVLAVAGALVVLIIEALLLASAAGGVWVLQGSAAVGSPDAALAIAARGLGFGAMMAALGGALAVLTRTTIAATAIPIVYLFLQMSVGVLYLIPGFERLAGWLPEHNIAAYLNFGTTFNIPVDRVTEHGVVTDFVERSLPFAQGLVYLLVLVGVVAAGSLLAFRRRDVT